MEFEQIRIYCEIDALLDTRLATLYLLDPMKVPDVLKNGYYSRITDEFLGYDQTVYLEAYKNRDERTLAVAMMTEAIFFINYFAESTLKALASTPLRRQPELVLNLHPYKLDEEAKKLIIKAITHHTKGLIDVSLVNMPYADLTPSMLKSEFAAVVMYEYWNWLEVHSENKNLETTQLPSVKLIAPALIRNKEAISAMPNLHIFKVIEQHTKPFIDLTTYPISKFSVDLRRASAFAEKMKVA